MPSEDTQFKPGNKCSVGNKGGRPRTSIPSKEEMIELGEEMIEWVKVNKPIHLSMWWLQEKDITHDVWNNMRMAPEFSHYYRKALQLVGYAYVDKESQVDGRIKDRWQRVYFKDLREQEDQDSKEEATRKASALVTETKAKEEILQEIANNRRTPCNDRKEVDSGCCKEQGFASQVSRCCSGSEDSNC